jgi:hypothetical protein
LKSSESGESAMKARALLSDPNIPSELRKMAEELLRMSRNADMRMTINAINPLVRELASLSDFEGEEVADLMGGIYNDAILYNQELMTPRNAQIFHEQFGRLLRRSIDFVRQREEIVRERERLAAEEARRRPKTPERKHLVGFLMVPFAQEFKTTIEGVRQVVEDDFGCELLTAADLTFENIIRGNVQAHIDNADFFVADVTAANPNVMHELGAVHYGRQGSPSLLIAGVDKEGQPPKLPADLQGHIAAIYSIGAAPEKIATILKQEFAKHQKLQALLGHQERERYLSPARLIEFTNNLLQSRSTYEALSARFPTASAWRGSKPEVVERVLGFQADLASAVLKRILANLDKQD